jgi:hypothetical protein
MHQELALAISQHDRLKLRFARVRSDELRCIRRQLDRLYNLKIVVLSFLKGA